MANNFIDTQRTSSLLREKAIDIRNKSVLVTNFLGSEQEKDFTEPTNCNGFGRIRHFKLDSILGWPSNPLPILPAAKALGIDSGKEIRAQVFQNSICNWRCWYCFVDYKLLNGDPKRASFLTCDEMLDLYLAQKDPPKMIDLTGGQPDLTPEWIPWMMQAIKDRGLDKEIFLWSDDNLSNDYLWRYLTDEQIRLLSSYEMYARVCCFKGIDEKSFSLNTKAEPQLFFNQFELCKRLLGLGLDLYCYITLTANTNTNFEVAIPKFFDAVQSIDEMLPLRIVPLKILEFTPVVSRMNNIFSDMIEGQNLAIKAWRNELEKRFKPELLELPITEVTYKNARR